MAQRRTTDAGLTDPATQRRKGWSQQLRIAGWTTVNRWVRHALRGDFIVSDLGAGNPSTGVVGREDWLLWQLTAYARTPVFG